MIVRDRSFPWPAQNYPALRNISRHSSKEKDSCFSRLHHLFSAQDSKRLCPILVYHSHFFDDGLHNEQKQIFRNRLLLRSMHVETICRPLPASLFLRGSFLLHKVLLYYW